MNPLSFDFYLMPLYDYLTYPILLSQAKKLKWDINNLMEISFYQSILKQEFENIQFHINHTYPCPEETMLTSEFWVDMCC